jgi:predicted TPR repeat methyltransferase
MQLQQYWDDFHTGRPTEKTGWWEETPEKSLSLVDRCDLAPFDLVVDAGAGSSTFTDNMLDRGFHRLVAVDISKAALDVLRARLGPERAASVRWIVDDLGHPSAASDLKDVSLWHDRAVLHFLTSAEERAAYANLVRQAIRPGGYAIFAAFSLTGATECSGLPVRNYDAAMFAEFLGPAFSLVESFDHVYVNPSGSLRPYVYALFRRA